jgi:transketolase
MEGLSHEACSLAGVFGLEKLVVLYDDNGISIDGHVAGWFADDTAKRFEAYGWHVVPDVDGHDAEAVDRAIRAALSPSGKPTLIMCKTVIGWGAPNAAGTHDVHGAPLGQEEAVLTREALGWPHDLFVIPDEIYRSWDARPSGARAEGEWEQRFAAYAREFPQLASEFRRRVAGELPEGFSARAEGWLGDLAGKTDAVATRKASQIAIEWLAGELPELLGGSADLTTSNLTHWKAARTVKPGGAGGNYIHYGVREFGMTAIQNGIALHAGFIPFGGTFLVFSDYARNAIRLAALMGIRSILVLTHDSIGLGEDGPTHQPIEHAASLRMIPNLDVWRPADLLETAVAWTVAVQRREGPTALLLTRQGVPAQPAIPGRAGLIARGGYILADADKADLVLISTGSEVGLAMEARRLLAGDGISARVVSMPSTTLFDRQPEGWRREVLPAGVPRLAIEAAAGDYWRKYVGLEGGVVGIDRFGESAPGNAVFRHFGFTAERVAEAARRLL